ncbi:TPA: tRNA pseudouridine(13) synthase TruD [Legionella feeleii]
MFDFNDLEFAHGKPQATGTMKTTAEDFKVDEELGFELSGQGEHLYLRIEKKGLNTEEVVKALARTLGKSEKNISYAGLKDRQALTTQWLCVHCPGEEIISPDLLAGEGWRVIESKRHLKKLKIGALEANRFNLILRDIKECEEVENRLQQIRGVGVPNYFGAQRFGYEGQNLVKAEAFFSGHIKVKNRFLRGIYYSAARAFLFNQILSARVKAATWNTALPGDVMQLTGKNSIFSIEAPDELIQTRVEDFDLSPAAPLWGKGQERVGGDALTQQEQVLDRYKFWCEALESHGLERAYRPLVLPIEDLMWNWQDNQLNLSFRLTSGSYATSVVRELIQLNT